MKRGNRMWQNRVESQQRREADLLLGVRDGWSVRRADGSGSGQSDLQWPIKRNSFSAAGGRCAACADAASNVVANCRI